MRRNSHKIDPYQNPVWLKYQCEHGARWTCVKGGTCEIPSGSECSFSGCSTGHRVHVVGETANPDEAADWFLNPYDCKNRITLTTKQYNSIPKDYRGIWTTPGEPEYMGKRTALETSLRIAAGQVDALPSCALLIEDIHFVIKD